MIWIKQKGFTTLECVISLFVVALIVSIMTSTLHNNFNLLRKNHEKRHMLYIAKEIIEDERHNLKYNDINQDYNKENTINNFTVKTWVTPMNNSKCYKLNVEVKNNYNEVELNTYVTKKI